MSVLSIERVWEKKSKDLVFHKILEIYLFFVFNRKCLTADTLSVWIYSDGQLEKVVTFCGHKLPPPIMSNGHRLTLEFKGASNAHFSRGFHANYAFLEG